MITIEFVSQFIQENFQKVTTSKNGTHFLARCVLCGDSQKSPSKRRFNLDWNNGNPIYHCFNCNSSGSFLELYSTIKGLTINEAKKDLYSFNPDYLIQQLNSRKKEKIIKEIEYEDYSYILDDCLFRDSTPDGILEKQLHKKLIGFIKDRKIPPEVPVYIAYKGDYSGRIILPIIQDGVITYFQARSLDSNKQKYKNPSLSKGNIIFNKDNFDRSKYIIVTEGIIDAMQVGTQGTSCLGASVNDDFLKTLFNLTDVGVILALDNDKTGINETVKVIKNSKFSSQLKYFLLIGHKYSQMKDLGEIAQKKDIKNVYDFVVFNSYTKFEALIQLKMGGFVNDEVDTDRKRLRFNK